MKSFAVGLLLCVSFASVSQAGQVEAEAAQAQAESDVWDALGYASGLGYFLMDGDARVQVALGELFSQQYTLDPVDYATAESAILTADGHFDDAWAHHVDAMEAYDDAVDSLDTSYGWNYYDWYAAETAAYAASGYCAVSISDSIDGLDDYDLGIPYLQVAEGILGL